MDDLVTNATSARFGVFLTILIAMAVLERLWPRRDREGPTGTRVASNLGIVAVGGLAVRVLVPLAPVAVALEVESRGGGLLAHLGLTGFGAIVVGMVLLDLAIWVQHIVFHHVPLLWRLHRTHHADVDLDVTSGIRFHPGEIVLSVLIKLVVVGGLGVPAVGVILFEIILNGMAMFNHANVHIPERVDALMRWLVVTPDFHRVHHSVHRDETNSNFGFNLSLWDRMFGTYVAAPRDGQLGMTVGLSGFREPQESRIDRLLTQPFRRDRRAD